MFTLLPMWPTKICFLFYLYFDELPSQKVILIYTSTCSMWNYMLGCIYTSIAAAAAKSLQSCPTLCDSIDSSPPGSPVPGILQARTLEWVAISFSNAWKWKVKGKSLSPIDLLYFCLVSVSFSQACLHANQKCRWFPTCKAPFCYSFN